jgi:hypothetical protein
MKMSGPELSSWPATTLLLLFLIATLTLLVCLEKVLSPRVPVSLMTGLLLSGWGLCVLTRQLVFGVSRPAKFLSSVDHG